MRQVFIPGPEQWTILVPRRKELYDYQNTSSAKDFSSSSGSSVLFRAKNNWDAWSKLISVPDSVYDESPPYHSSLYVDIASSTIESLPSEIVSMILESPELLKEDIIAFGLASPALWLHVLQYVSHDCRHPTTLWAGVEIAKIGDRLRDLPTGFKEGDLFASSVNLDNVPYFGFSGHSIANRLFKGAHYQYARVSASPQAQWSAALKPHLATHLRPRTMELFSAASPIPQAVLMKLWVLRNLTTKDYIRCRFDIDTQRAFVETKLLRLSIEDALELRFCWPSNLDVPPHSDTGSGLWAGNAFDIVLAAEEVPIMKGEGWLDITEGIVKEGINRLSSLEGRTLPFRDKDEDYQMAKKGAKDLWFNRR